MPAILAQHLRQSGRVIRRIGEVPVGIGEFAHTDGQHIKPRVRVRRDRAARAAWTARTDRPGWAAWTDGPGTAWTARPDGPGTAWTARPCRTAWTARTDRPGQTAWTCRAARSGWAGLLRRRLHGAHQTDFRRGGGARLGPARAAD